MPELDELIGEYDELPKFPTFSLKTWFLGFPFFCNIPWSAALGNSTNNKKSDLVSLTAEVRISSPSSLGQFLEQDSEGIVGTHDQHT